MAKFEKVIGTITVNKNILQVDNQFAGNMFSSDLTYNVNFADDFWDGFEILEWYAASSVVGETVVCKYDSTNKKLKIPYGAYIKNGPLYISMRGIKDSVKYSTNILVLVVGENINIEENDIIQENDWLDKVQAIIDDVFVSKYDPQYEVLVQKVEKQISTNKELLDKTQEQQTQIDNAIDVMGDYEIVQDNPTQIRFKKGDGTYGDTVNLGDNLASKSMVNAGYDTYSGNSYSGSASDYGIEIGKASGNYEQEGTPTPESPVEPKFFEPKHIISSGNNLYPLDNFADLNSNFTIDDDGWFVINHTNNTGGIEFFNIYHKPITELKKNSAYYFAIELEKNIFSGSPTLYINSLEVNSSNSTQFENGNTTFRFNSDNKTVLLTTKESFDSSQYLLRTYLYIPNGSSIDFKFRITLSPIENASFETYKSIYTTPLSLILRALSNGVKDTYEDDMITRKVGYVEFDGSSDENWKYGSEAKVFYTPASEHGAKYQQFILCDRFGKASGTEKYENKKCAIDRVNLWFKYDSLGQSVDAWKKWLQSNPIKVWYELAELTTEQVDLPVIPSYFPYTNAWHDSKVEASDLTWNILAGQYGSGQTTIKKDEAVLTELDLNTERTATPTIVKVQLKDTSGNTFYVETSADNVYLKGTDGSEISQQNLNEKFGQLINLVAFFSANPVELLSSINNYIPSTQTESEE